MSHQPAPEKAESPGRGTAGASDDLSGQTFGDFRILRRIGVGGMGEVYLAEQISLHRRVALKILRTDLAKNETSRRRFEAEARAVAQLNHPNIVQVYAVGTTRGVPYMALEYVDGRNLREYLARKGPPPLPQALSLMRQVASALQRASELGIIHRDIKPENILLTRKGEVKVADFGLSRMIGNNAVANNLTQTGVTMGTPLYMSPEQVEGRPLDHRTDIYSFGVTCYHMLTGNPPFEGENAFSVALQHVQAEPMPIEAMRPDLPQEVCAVLEKMMAKNPDDRYATAGELLRDLRRVSAALGGTAPVPVSPGSSGTASSTMPTPESGGRTATMPWHLPRKSHRKAIWLASAVAGSIVVAALIGGGFAWYLRADEAKRMEQAQKTSTDSSPVLQAVLGSYEQAERGLLDVIATTENPGNDPRQITKGLQYRIDLAILYLDQVPRELDKAWKLFTAQAKSDVRQYAIFGRVGQAMVLAFRDQPKQSYQVLADLLGEFVGQRQFSLFRSALRIDPVRNPKWSALLLEAHEHNRRNLAGSDYEPPMRVRRFFLMVNRALENRPGSPSSKPGTRRPPR